MPWRIYVQVVISQCTLLVLASHQMFLSRYTKRLIFHIDVYACTYTHWVCLPGLPLVSLLFCLKLFDKIYTSGLKIFKALLYICVLAVAVLPCLKQHSPVQHIYHVFLTLTWKIFSFFFTYSLHLFSFVPTVLTKKYITFGSRLPAPKYSPCIITNLNLFQMYNQYMRLSFNFWNAFKDLL